MDEETGMRVIQHLRAAFGETRPLIETPGHVFSVDEFVDARAFWTLPIIFGWDAMLFPESSDYFVFNSHDEFISLVCRTKETYSRLLDEFKDWNPEESDCYFR